MLVCGVRCCKACDLFLCAIVAKFRELCEMGRGEERQSKAAGREFIFSPYGPGCLFTPEGQTLNHIE